MSASRNTVALCCKGRKMWWNCGLCASADTFPLASLVCLVYFGSDSYYLSSSKGLLHTALWITMKNVQNNTVSG